MHNNSNTFMEDSTKLKGNSISISAIKISKHRPKPRLPQDIFLENHEDQSDY